MAGSATTVELLKPLAREHVVLEPRSEHYARPAPAARCTTSSAGCSRTARRASPPNGAVRLLEAGGERAEAELVGASVLELLRDGMAPEDIAVLVRSNAELFAQVFETYAIPVARERRVPFAHTRLGAGLLAFARAALGERHGEGRRHVAAHAGQARHARRASRRRLARPSRPTPRRRHPGAARRRRPRSRSRVRRAEARTAADARYHWGTARRRATSSSSTRWPRRRGRRAVPRRAAGRGRGDLDRAARPPRRRARPRGRGRRARGPRAARARSKELHAPARAGPGARRRAEGRCSRRWPRSRCARPSAVADGAPGVLLADPLAIRARRFRAIFVCGLQEGELPRRPQPEPFLDDGARAALAIASGLVLARHEDTLARERSLFYACVSRPEEALFLSLPQLRRGGRPAAAVAVPRRRPRAVHRRAVGRSAAGGCWPRSRGRPPRRRRRTSCAAPRPPGRSEPAAAAARRARRPRGPARCSPPATASPRAGWRRSPAARSSG